MGYLSCVYYTEFDYGVYLSEECKSLQNVYLIPFPILLVHAPSKLTTFKCFPRCTIIFSSEARAFINIASAVGFTILTATIVVDLSSMIPNASALRTTPNAPEPSCLPVRCNKLY